MSEAAKDHAPGFDSRELRNVLGQFCTGITIITTTSASGAARDERSPQAAHVIESASGAARDERSPQAAHVIEPGSGQEPEPMGFACQSFAALSLEPPLVLFCPMKSSRSWAAIESSGKFAVNMLAEDQQDVCATFGSRTPDKFSSVDWHPSELGSPILDGALAWIDCTVETVHDGGDHFVVFGRVHSFSEAKNERPLLFYRGQYTGIEPDKTVPAPWRADLEDFLITASSPDTWL